MAVPPYYTALLTVSKNVCDIPVNCSDFSDTAVIGLSLIKHLC